MAHERKKVEAGAAKPSAIMGWRSNVKKFISIAADKIVSALAVISVPHKETHDGEMWLVSYKSPDASPIADNGTIVFGFTTGASKQDHMIFAVEAGGDAQLELYEDTDFSLGDLFTARNKNRHIQNPDARVTTGIRLNPTIADDGTLLQDKFIAGGTGGNSPGGMGGVRDEWIFDTNTLYIVRATNRAGNAQPMSLECEWYEEDADPNL